jgi:hypothetical protein
VWHPLGASFSGLAPLAGPSEHINELLGFFKWEFIDQLSEYRVLKDGLYFID